MRRREFIKLIVGMTVTPPLAVLAQGSMPVIGLLSSQSSSGYAPLMAAFREGLREAGFVEGQNVTIEYRWAEGQTDRLPGLAADLVHRRVAVIAATGASLPDLPPRLRPRPYRSWSAPAWILSRRDWCPALIDQAAM